jgi:hypothetical protein
MKARYFKDLLWLTKQEEEPSITAQELRDAIQYSKNKKTPGYYELNTN